MSQTAALVRVRDADSWQALRKTQHSDDGMLYLRKQQDVQVLLSKRPFGDTPGTQESSHG